jgi:ribosomal protein S18 acetylase RimI-like enzyme
MYSSLIHKIIINGKDIKLNIIFKKCIEDDLFLLHEISCKTFNETFAHLNTPENMKAFLEQAYNKDKLYKELINKNSDFYFLYADEALSGYIKINDTPAQTDIFDIKSLEIERIYVNKEFQGKGFGGLMINKATEIALTRNKTYIWLGVWENNIKAITFYKKNGFYQIGKHPFYLGADKQTDFIMRKDLR